ncbi:hypothetical protein [Thiohalorhabdus methylotrophus]|uniref:Uncharacterized protein n=1 Tax=Thiohalorhabdus methylotrophus TaxID=3242694 RepID=A0ABV4TZ62_9GAMM
MERFAERYWGRFTGCIRWEQAEDAARGVEAMGGVWYAARPEAEESDDAERLDGAGAARLLRTRLAEMRRLKKGEFCNLVFVDDAEAPNLIKIFHPRRAGDACRVGGEPVRPWLVLSRYPVDPTVFAPRGEGREGKRTWWKRMLRIGAPE